MLRIGMVLAVLAVLGIMAVQGLIFYSTRSVAALAQDEFGGDSVTALMRAVECRTCSLSQRNKAVWALGEIADSRALPVLRAYYKGGRCSHDIALCQYELRKAIRKTEGTWGWRASLRLDD